MSDRTIVGFIGTGVMGSSMAGHLLAGENEVHVYNRTKSKAEKLIQAGAVWENSPSELASKCSIIFTIVGYPKDVEDVYLGKNGLIASAAKGSLLVDMTTSSPKLAERIWEEARSKGISVLDAPVTGGDKGAREAKLTILVGGEKEDFERALPYFRLMGTNIRHMGKAGCGQYTKLANQITIAGTMTGMCEGLAFAKGCGLDQKEVLEAISGGAAGSWSLTNYGPRILNGDFDPGFFVKHYIKDMKLAEESADEIGLDMPALSLTRELYEEISEGGLDEAGTQSLYCLYDPEEE
ncbi:MAG: NAD(P)-dependent oxidoreductase [Synergistaceae bacterium]|jgi:3-hydroxyisobutyrate dehydrogenase|nr:NAD(P)-dependent oxidoreductase [Synergistaceae bacterium]